MKKYILVFILFLLAFQVFGQNPIIIQGAMDIEIKGFLDVMKNPQKIVLHNYNFWKGKIFDKNIIISKTEIGPVNAAVSSCIGIENFSPEIIINQGTCGAIIPELDNKDIIIGKYYVDYSGSKTQYLDYGEGSNPLKWTPLFYNIEETEFKKIECDKFLTEQAKKIKYDKGKVVTGTIGSAFQWNMELDRLKWINKTFGIICEDMETAISAMTAKIYNVDFIGIRIISDNVITGQKFEPKVALHCSDFVLDFIKNLKLPSR